MTYDIAEKMAIRGRANRPISTRQAGRAIASDLFVDFAMRRNDARLLETVADPSEIENDSSRLHIANKAPKAIDATNSHVLHGEQVGVCVQYAMCAIPNPIPLTAVVTVNA